ncbi:hypothetical protein Trydic_g14351 [Trypoxylus dichotomus]
MPTKTDNLHITRFPSTLKNINSRSRLLHLFRRSYVARSRPSGAGFVRYTVRFGSMRKKRASGPTAEEKEKRRCDVKGTMDGFSISRLALFSSINLEFRRTSYASAGHMLTLLMRMSIQDGNPRKKMTGFFFAMG